LTVFERLVDEGKTVLMVTHDRDVASRVSRTIRIADGELVDDVYQNLGNQEVAYA
jgi:predicted ABC-type transport system involved in lysophospholipase L1 biosynthesis ATPase subunit